MISINPDVKLIRKMENLSKNELKKVIDKSKEIIKKLKFITLQNWNIPFYFRCELFTIK